MFLDVEYCFWVFFEIMFSGGFFVVVIEWVEVLSLVL